MKTYDEILKEVCNFFEYGLPDDEMMMMVYKRAAIKYAEEISKDAVYRCAENAKIKEHFNNGSWVTMHIDKESILNTKIILP